MIWGANFGVWKAPWKLMRDHETNLELCGANLDLHRVNLELRGKTAQLCRSTLEHCEPILKLHGNNSNSAWIPHRKKKQKAHKKNRGISIPATTLKFLIEDLILFISCIIILKSIPNLRYHKSKLIFYTNLLCADWWIRLPFFWIIHWNYIAHYHFFLFRRQFINR